MQELLVLATGIIFVLLLRTRSAPLEILGFHMGGAYLYREIFAVLNYGEKAELSKCS